MPAITRKRISSQSRSSRRSPTSPCPTRGVRLFLPARTPTAIAQKLNDAVIRTVQSADIRERLDGLTFEPTAAPLRETADYVKSELVKWAKVVRDTGAKAE